MNDDKLNISIGKYIVLILTLISLFPIFIIRLKGFDTTLLWVYSILTTSSLIFIYFFTYKYKAFEGPITEPTVAVIVPCKNEEGTIGKTIEAILNSNYPKEKLNIIVVDDGSTDRTLSMVQKYENSGVKVIKHEKNKGKREAFATGLRNSESEIVICIDSDTIVDKEAIRLLMQPFSDDDVVAVCGHGEAANKNKNTLTKMQHYWYQKMYLAVKGMESYFNTVSCCSGILAAYRRKDVNIVLDRWLSDFFLGRKLMFSDDRQLTNLVSKNDNPESTRRVKIIYQKSAVAYTMVPETYKKFIKQQIRWKRGWLHCTRFAIKFMWRKEKLIAAYYYTSVSLAIIMPIVVIRWLILAPIKGEITAMLVYLLSLFYISILHGINVWSLSKEARKEGDLSDYIMYTILFVPVSVILALVNVYAWLTCWKTGWLTRN
ncbi:MAG: glycosyltransferase [Methanogenium sp.]|jgi:hyaluronan synthase